MNAINVCIREDYVKKDGTSSVFLKLYINGKKVEVPTGVDIQPDFFDHKNKRISKAHPKAEELNMILIQAMDRANDIFIRYKLQERELSVDKFKKAFKNPSNYIDFYKWMEMKINDRKGMLRPATIILHQTILRKLIEYKKNVTFSEIDMAFIEGFEKWLKMKKKNDLNTIHKNLRTLKSYLNIAIKEDIITSNPFKKIRMKRGPGRMTYINEEELKVLINKYNNKELMPHLQKVLQYFLFSCCTGLRISDVKLVNKEMIINDILIFEPLKTKSTSGKIVKIPIMGFAKKLINDAGKFKVVGRIFETYSDQKTNEYLKDIATLCGIQKSISFHVSRHTFATLFLEHTSDLATLQQLMGHANIAQTMVYAHVSEKKKQDQIKKFAQIFE